MTKRAEKSVAALQAENDELRARLDEAEQTLEAIRSGKVDALVVGGPEGERIFTLQGADHRYRRLVEGMTEGAAIVSSAGVVLYANVAFARLVGSPLDRVLGSPLRSYVPPEALAAFDRLLDTATGATAQAEAATIIRAGDRILPVQVSAAVSSGDKDNADICIVVTDLSGSLRDAERRRTQLSADLQKAMRENEAQRKLFTSLFSNAPASISLLRGPEHVVELANAGALALWGRSADDVVGKPLRQVLPEIASQDFPAILDEVYRSGDAFVGDQMAVRLGRVGEDRLATRYVNAVYSPTRDADGAVDGVTSFTLDVTAQVEARKRAAESEEQFRQLIDNLPDLAWHARPDGFIEFFNRRWYEYTGTTLEQMRGEGWTSVHRADFIDAVVERWRSAVVSGESFEMEFPLRGAGGTYRWFLTRARPLRDTDGRIVRWVGTNTDIDARRRALEAMDLLAQTSAVLSSTLDYEETITRIAELAVPRVGELCAVYLRGDGGVRTHVATAHGNGEMVRVLRAVREERFFPENVPFGYAEVVRTGRTELQPHVGVELYRDWVRNPEHLAELLAMNLRAWIGVPLTRQGHTIGALFFAVTTEGRTYTADDVPLAEEIGKRASLAIENARLYRDARVAVAAERSARDKAEEATRLKDEFLATLSHELRTPLNAILGWSRLLQSGGIAEERRARAVDTVVRNAIAQNQLIEDMLDLGRIISGKMRLTVQSIELSPIVDAALDVVQPAADARGVVLVRAIGDEPLPVSGDAGRLQQVVWNLLSNAVKFTPRGGRVTVTVARRDTGMEIAVADTGSGISAPFLPFVFDRFRQQDGAITRKTGGLGLGLAIVKSIVELHGGTVDATSAGEGHGSTFVVHLPVSETRALAAAPETTSDASLRDADGSMLRPAALVGLRVLVVDDEPDARELLRALFEHCRATVTTAASVAEAMGHFDRARYDVIVSDIGMPVENGYDLIRQVRARAVEAGGKVPAIALTAYARSEDRRRALVEGFQTHVAKPIDPNELLLIVAAATATQRGGASAVEPAAPHRADKA